MKNQLIQENEELKQTIEFNARLVLLQTKRIEELLKENERLKNET